MMGAHNLPAGLYVPCPMDRRGRAALAWRCWLRPGARLRPPTSCTNRLKDQGLVDYGAAPTLAEARTLRRDYEEDHLISLEIGSAPRDPANLWPEPWTGPDNARQKDVRENLCHAEVCDEHIALADAQQQIAEDWRTACQ